MSSISVIIPVFNAEKYLAEAIESVLGQSRPPNQVIIVNDGSTDKSAEVAERFISQATVLHQSNQGIGAARNRGIQEAWGDFLAFIDADDIWDKDKLHDQLEIFSQDEHVDIVFGHARQFFSPDLPQEVKAKLVIQQEILPARLAGSMLIRKQTFMQVGLFSQDWRTGVDQEWAMRAVDSGLNWVMLPQVLYLRRIHENNHGRRMKHFMKDRLGILKEAIDRRSNDK